MRRAISGLVLGCLFLASTACDAGGMFRRVPEVGEWATYRRTAETTFFSTTAGTIESTSEGSTTLKCVGEVERDGVRHLWIEVRWINGDPGNSEGWAVIKLLIPEDKVVDSDFAEHAVAAWAASSNFEVYEVPVDWESLRHDECVSTLLISLPWTSRTVRRREQRTIVINERVELTLEFAETGRLDE